MKLVKNECYFFSFQSVLFVEKDCREVSDETEPAFRSHREDAYSSNKSNFIELVELMSKYDPVFGEHYLKEGNDNQQYLSPKIQNEVLYTLGNHVKEN